MKILVFLKEVSDIRVPLEFNERSGGLRADGHISQLNPPDHSALEASLRIKESFSETHVTLIHMGPTSGERWIRESLALECDEGLRIWEEGLDEVRAAGKALIFSRIAEILGFDLILTGNRSLDTASGQVGILMACHLSIPHISSVMELELEWKDRSIIARKSLARGYQARTRSPLPLVITMEGYLDLERYASFPALLENMDREIPCWDLDQIGMPREQIKKMDSFLTFGPLRFPRPRTKFIPAPDYSLPAFERIKKLLEGTVQSRGGKVIQRNEDSVVKELFQTLLEEGWLDHLQKER